VDSLAIVPTGEKRTIPRSFSTQASPNCSSEVDNRFGIGLGLENMAMTDQVAAKLPGSCNISPLKNDVNAAVFVG